jgi:hypothetical protein
VQWPARRPLSLLNGHGLAQPIVWGVLTGGKGYSAIPLSLLPGGALRRQLVLQAAKCLVLFDPLMGRLGLKHLDRRSRFLKQVLRLLASGDLLAQGLSRSVDPVDAGAIIVVAVQDSDRRLAIADKAATVRRRWPSGSRWRRTLRQWRRVFA